MLASRKMTPEFNSVLIDVVKVINHIKAHALNSCRFEQLCEEMDAEHRGLPLYAEIKWLSQVKLLTTVFEIREPLQKFLSEKKSPLAAHFSDKEWVAKLAYLRDIFKLLNGFNLSLQEKITTVFKLADKVAAFKAKLYHLQVYLAKMKFNLALIKFISCFLLAIFIFWHNFKKISFLNFYNILFLLVTNNININIYIYIIRITS